MGRIGALMFVVWVLLWTYSSVSAYVPGQYVWWIPVTAWFILALGVPVAGIWIYKLCKWVVKHV